MSKLATIAKIRALEPIPDADRIERATVLGWSVIVRKGLHEVGDLVVMIFPDTLVPKKYLDPSYVGDEKVRLKTVKMKGQYSAGLVIPLADWATPHGEYGEGDDVAELLGVEKYETPTPAGDALELFPTAIVSKTDEDNYRTNPSAIEELGEERFKDASFVATLKCDGSSGTFFLKEGLFRVCSRNLELRETEGNAFWQAARKYRLEEVMREQGVEYAIQGEVCGPGIQGNPMKLKSLSLFVFLIKDLSSARWLPWEDTVEFCNTHNIPLVEELFRIAHYHDMPRWDELQAVANNTKYDNGKTNAEGIVLRTTTPIHSKVLGKAWWSVKIMNEPYDTKK
jgi:RNA ligase (TIGR02306 family)